MKDVIKVIRKTYMVRQNTFWVTWVDVVKVIRKTWIVRRNPESMRMMGRLSKQKRRSPRKILVGR